MELSPLFDELNAHRYLIEGVIATGGEPALQPDPLEALAEWTHRHKLKFGIMTNGTKPTVIESLLNADLLDYVAVDIKTVPNEKEYARITQAQSPILSDINTTISLLKSSSVNYEFRTTLVPSIVDKISQIQEIMNWVGAKHYVLQSFRPTDTVLDSKLSQPFSNEELDKFQVFANEHNVKTRF